MKQKLFTFFLALATNVGTIFADAVQIGDLYYNLNDEDNTAEVTYQGFEDNYSNLRAATIPETVEYELKTYSVTNIGDYAFYGCASLSSATIGNSVTNIGDYAFLGCTSLTSIDIPNSVTSIGNGSFSRCSNLASIKIPNSVTSIGMQTFVGCVSLPIENNLRYADTYLVEAVDEKLTSYTIKAGTRWIGYEAFRDCSKLTSIEIPNSVTYVGNYAFRDCWSLTSVKIPNSVTSIGDETFYRCSSLPIEGGIRYADTYLVELDDYELPTYTIKAGTRWIGGGAFESCSSLTSIEIPNSVIRIGGKAFYGCSNLVSIEIPNSVTSIGGKAFSYCNSLISVTIGSSVIDIQERAFADCTSLTSVTCFATTPPEMDEGKDNDGVFANLDCSKIPLYVQGNSIDLYKNANQWKDFGAILPISAKETETNTVKAEPTETSVDVTWPSVPGAYTYELVIKDKNGKVICTLVFNAQGQLLSIAFNAPANGKAPQQTQSAGFSFVVTGLNEGTDYDLTITAKGENGKELDKKNVTFHTNGSTGIEDIVVDKQKANKILHDGQIYILRGDHIFDTQGKMVR